MAATLTNKQVIYKTPPKEYPKPGEHFELVSSSFDPKSVQLGSGDILTRNLYLSLDPFLRGKMRDPSIKSYTPAFEKGKPMQGIGIGEVYKSNNSQFKEGDLVCGMINWEEYSHFRSDDLKPRAIQPMSADSKKSGLPLSFYVGVLGMPGLTAYMGLHMIGKPKAGETILISSASGAVGQIVGQLSKIYGLKVIGLAGDDSKCKFLSEELKFDTVINYKKCDLEQKLKEVCPNGIDIYWDNVGGKTLDAVFNNCNLNGRIVTCGMISAYNTDKPEPLYNSIQVLVKRLTMQGFIVFDHEKEYQDKFSKEVTEYLKSGKIKFKESVVEGLDKSLDTFVDMLTGKQFGKVVIKIAEPGVATH